MATPMQSIVRTLRELSALKGEDRSVFFSRLPQQVREDLARYHLTPEFLHLLDVEREQSGTRSTGL